MSSKSKTESKSTMTYGQTAPIDSPDISTYRQQVEEDTGRADPTIGYAAANEKKELENNLGNQFGADFAPETREAMYAARLADINTRHGQALRQDAYNRRQTRLSHYGNLAALTSPRTVQTGGSTTGTVTQPIWPGLIMGGLSAGLGMG